MTDADHGGIGHAHRTGFPAVLPRGLPKHLVHRVSRAAGQQSADHMAGAFRREATAVHAHPGHPYRRGRLLDRPRPDVDVAVVEILAFPVERPIRGGQCFQDQVVRFPIPPHQARGIGVGGRDLIRRALHQPHLQTAAGQHVQPRHLFRDAHRVGPVGDRIAQGQQSRPLGFARDHRQRHRHGNRHAGRGAVVLVHHDVEPDFVAQRELIEVAVQQFGALRPDQGSHSTAGSPSREPRFSPFLPSAG